MLTILTPTYNRAYTLIRLYESLKYQKVNCFEWIIVDDGSTDNTENLVTSWKLENDLSIKYYKQTNGGKHRAINNGVKYSNYEYIYILDSDDYLVENAVEKICNWITECKYEKLLAGISGLKAQLNNNEYKVIGQYPSGSEYVDATNIERKKYKLLGDKAEVYKKEILLKYSFPEFEGENFLSEDAVWNLIALDGYKVRWYGEIICICEYLEDGLTRNNSDIIKLKNFQGYTYTQKLNVKCKPFPYSSFFLGEYIRVGKLKGLSLKLIKEKMEVNLISIYLAILINNLRILINRIRKRKIN